MIATQKIDREAAGRWPAMLAPRWVEGMAPRPWTCTGCGREHRGGPRRDYWNGRGVSHRLHRRRVDPEFNQRIAASYQIMRENLRRVHAAGIPVVLGTDAGNPLTLHGAAVYPEMEAMAEAGLSPMDVLVASTRDAARAMGRTDFGTLAPGQIADLVVLDRDPLADIANARSVRLVVRGGEPWTRAELEYR